MSWNRHVGSPGPGDTAMLVDGPGSDFNGLISVEGDEVVIRRRNDTDGSISGSVAQRVKVADLLWLLKEHQTWHDKAIDARITVLRRQMNKTAERVGELENAIRKHRDQRGDDRCWLDDKDLYAVLNEPFDEKDFGLPTRERFLSNCAKFHETRQPEDAPIAVGEPGRWVSAEELLRGCKGDFGIVAYDLQGGDMAFHFVDQERWEQILEAEALFEGDVKLEVVGWLTSDDRSETERAAYVPKVRRGKLLVSAYTQTGVLEELKTVVEGKLLGILTF